MLAAAILAAVLYGAGTSTYEASQSSAFSTAAIEDTVRGAYQNDLLAKQRESGGEAAVSVVRVDCVEEAGALLTCLAHVVTPGKRNDVTEVPIRVTRTGKGEFSYRITRRGT